MAEESKPGATVTQVPARLIRSKDFRVVFSNTFRFRVGQADIGIAFGYQSEIPGPGGQEQTILTDEVEVVLTPMMLKLFQLAISDNIETLETVLGKPIEIPQSILDGLAEQRAKAKAELAAQLQGSAPRSDEARRAAAANKAAHDKEWTEIPPDK